MVIMATPTLSLVSTQTAITYSFRAAPGQFGWASCTINDTTGELLITSDWGNWSHRWSPDPRHLGAPSLTAFIGTRGDIDYLASKLQGGGLRAGRRWSAEKTAIALRRRLCERRLEAGRAQLENRLEPEDLDGYGRVPTHLLGRYTEHGLPIFSDHYDNAPTWSKDHGRERLPYLSRDTAHRLWDAISALANDVSRSADLFFERLQQIDGFADYVTEEPWEYSETEQTPEDRALRGLVLPALIEACRPRENIAPPMPEGETAEVATEPVKSTPVPEGARDAR